MKTRIMHLPHFFWPFIKTYKIQYYYISKDDPEDILERGEWLTFDFRQSLKKAEELAQWLSLYDRIDDYENDIKINKEKKQFTGISYEDGVKKMYRYPEFKYDESQLHTYLNLLHIPIADRNDLAKIFAICMCGFAFPYHTK